MKFQKVWHHSLSQQSSIWTNHTSFGIISFGQMSKLRGLAIIHSIMLSKTKCSIFKHLKPLGMMERKLFLAKESGHHLPLMLKSSEHMPISPIMRAWIASCKRTMITRKHANIQPNACGKNTKVLQCLVKVYTSTWWKQWRDLSTCPGNASKPGRTESKKGTEEYPLYHYSSKI